MIVHEIDVEGTTVCGQRVAVNNVDKVIGKQGKTARAMRTIMSASGTNIGKRCILEIIE